MNYIIVGQTLSEVYLGMLYEVVQFDEHIFVVGRVLEPIVNGKINVTKEFIERLGAYTFPDGRTGYDWLLNRVDAVFETSGEYYKILMRDDQMDYIIDALRSGSPAWNYNRFIATLFTTSDLHRNRNPTPPCMINLQFVAHSGKVDLIGTFRAQYEDIKGFGNLYSLAKLMKKIPKPFKPGELYMVAHKAILRYPKKIGKEFLNVLNPDKKLEKNASDF